MRAAAAAAAVASPPAPASTSTNADGFDGETAETSSELRRLRVELDKKGSELDTAIKEHAAVREELKVFKDMLGAAANAAGAAGADEESLRKRVSQLVCENGLLKGEKDRQEALAAEARAEAKSNTSRAATEVERLEREVERLASIAGKASGAAEDGDRARAALSAMEARLSEVRQERAELQASAVVCAVCNASKWYIVIVFVLSCVVFSCSLFGGQCAQKSVIHFPASFVQRETDGTRGRQSYA